MAKKTAIRALASTWRHVDGNFRDALTVRRARRTSRPFAIETQRINSTRTPDDEDNPERSNGEANGKPFFLGRKKKKKKNPGGPGDQDGIRARIERRTMRRAKQVPRQSKKQAKKPRQSERSRTPRRTTATCRGSLCWA